MPRNRSIQAVVCFALTEPYRRYEAQTCPADRGCSQYRGDRHAMNEKRKRRSSAYFMGQVCAATDVPERSNCFPSTLTSSRAFGSFTKSWMIWLAYRFVRSRNSRLNRPCFSNFCFPFSIFRSAQITSLSSSPKVGFLFSNFCFLISLQITSAKVLSVLRKYQMPSHSIKTTTAIESRKPDR